MKNTAANSAFTALSLKLIGVVLIVSFLLDSLILLIPPQLQSTAWQVTTVSRIVDTGVIALVGIAFLLLGYFVESNANSSTPLFDLRPIALWIAAILGAVFIVFIPLYLNSLRLETNRQLAQIEQQVTQAEAQIQNQSQTQAEQLRQILQNPDQVEQLNQRIDQAIASGQLNPQQLERAQATKDRFQTLIDDPQAADSLITQNIEAAETRLGQRKGASEARIKSESLKRGIQTGISSLLLAICYMAVSWTGLRRLG